MDYNTFFDGIEEIYAIFGRKTPEERIIEVAYKRVKNLPDDFMAYIIRHFEKQENMPRNLGYYLLHNLWPEYLAKNPELKSQHEKIRCPLCCKDVPGFRLVWKEIIIFDNELSYKPELVRCKCGNANNPRNEPIFTDNELFNMGFLLDRPVYYRQEDLPVKWRRIIGHNEEPRARHIHEIEKYDSIPF